MIIYFLRYHQYLYRSVECTNVLLFLLVERDTYIIDIFMRLANYTRVQFANLERASSESIMLSNERYFPSWYTDVNSIVLKIQESSEASHFVKEPFYILHICAKYHCIYDAFARRGGVPKRRVISLYHDQRLALSTVCIVRHFMYTRKFA